MSLFIRILLSTQVSLIQILIAAYVGALIGEVQKEINDDEEIKFLEFFVSWFSSGFVGTMVGMILQGTVAKDNVYLVAGGTGVAGIIGRKKALILAQKIIISALKTIEDSDDEDEPKKSKQKSTKKNKK